MFSPGVERRRRVNPAAASSQDLVPRQETLWGSPANLREDERLAGDRGRVGWQRLP